MKADMLLTLIGFEHGCVAFCLFLCLRPVFIFPHLSGSLMLLKLIIQLEGFDEVLIKQLCWMQHRIISS